MGSHCVDLSSDCSLVVASLPPHPSPPSHTFPTPSPTTHPSIFARTHRRGRYPAATTVIKDTSISIATLRGPRHAYDFQHPVPSFAGRDVLLTSFENLEELHLRFPFFSSQVLTCIAHLRSLRKLIFVLRGCPVNVIGLPRLQFGW